MAKSSNNRLQCSFCGKSQDQVKKLIAGPGVYVCDECVCLCNEILDDEGLSKTGSKSDMSGVDLGDIRTSTDDNPDEEFLKLAENAIEPLEELLKYYRGTKHPCVLEAILKTILFLKAGKLGRYSKELLPLLAEAKEHCIRIARDDAVAEILEWSLAVRAANPELEVPKNDVLDLIQLHIKLGNQKAANELLKTLRDASES